MFKYLLVLLLLIPMLANAGQYTYNFHVIPLTPTQALNDVKYKENAKICQRRSRVSASALSHAMKGAPLPKQLAQWDVELKRPKYNDITPKEKDTLKGLMQLGYTVHTKYPEIKPTDFGDMAKYACQIEQKAVTKEYNF